MFATIISKDEDWFLVCDKAGQINVFESSEQEISAIENTYSRAHSRGYEASMSACFHSLQFRPTVVEIPSTIEKVLPLLESEILMRISSISGSYYGVQLKKEAAEGMLKTSIRPRLI